MAGTITNPVVPTSTPAPYTTAIPGTATYGQAALSANTAYQKALAQINLRRQQTLQNAGYLGQIDPKTGVLKNIRVDPYNQFGGLQTMLRGQAQGDEQAQMDAQERGLRGGWANKGVSELAYQHGGQSAQFGEDFTNNLGDLQDQQNSAAYARDQALYQAQLDAAQQAIDTGQFNPGDQSGTDYPDYGSDPYTRGELGAPAAKPKTSGAQTVRWGGSSVNRNQLIRMLVASHQSPSAWARAHAPAASRLGIGSRPGSNTTLIKHAIATAKKRR